MATGPIGLPATGPLTAPVRRHDAPTAPTEATPPGTGGAPTRGPSDSGFAIQAGNTSELGVGASDMGVHAAPAMSLDDLFGEEPAARTAADARRGAEAIWFPAHDEAGSTFRRIERDAVDANSLSGPRAAQLKDEIAANRDLEEAALQKLSKPEQQEYKHLASMTQHDPDARLALQLLLVEGKLTDKANLSSDHKDLLATLNGLSHQPLAKGLDRPSLISDMIQEIAVPSAINQHNKGTCTVTSLQIMMAMEQPAEYARIVSGLASPSGKAKLANGDTITREPGTIGKDGTPRTASAKLWQPAMMEYANGSLNYDNKTDTNSNGAGGLNAAQVHRALEGLTGKDGTTFSVYGEAGTSYRSRLGMAEAVMNQANSGKPVPVGMKFAEPGQAPGGHEVLVTKVAVDPQANPQLEQAIQQMEASRPQLEKDLENPARSAEAKLRLESIDRSLPALKERLEEERTTPRVYYDNPWGKEESMPMDAFVNRLTSANLEPLAETPASALKNQQAVMNNLDERLTTLYDRQVAAKNDTFNPKAPQQYLETRQEVAAIGELRSALGAFRPSPDLTAEQKEQANQVLADLNRLAGDLMDPAKREAAGPEVTKQLEALRQFA
ncbi:MAG TPA: hypothetical protein V6D05_01600 [Stenomitos sp.]